MTRRKISYADYMNLSDIENPSLMECMFCGHYLEHHPEDNLSVENYAIVKQMRLWVYLLLFIPGNLLEFFYRLWDGGLREFCPFMYKNMTSRTHFYAAEHGGPSPVFVKCEELWNKGR